MTKHGPDLYFDHQFMIQPNHSRVARMLHEMQFIPHEERRHLDALVQPERRHPDSWLDWDDRQTPH